MANAHNSVRYHAAAFGKSTWISSRVFSGHDHIKTPLTNVDRLPLTHAVAYRNSFGAVTFDWCSSADEAAALAAKESAWGGEVEIVSTTVVDETNEDVR